MVPSTLHQKLIIWNEEGNVEVVYADDNPCCFQQAHADFKVYNPKVKPIVVDTSSFDSKLIDGCYFGPNGLYFMPKAEAGLARQETLIMDLYMVKKQLCIKEVGLDCIYDFSPLAFEKSFEEKIKRVKVQDSIEKVNLGKIVNTDLLM